MDTYLPYRHVCYADFTCPVTCKVCPKYSKIICIVAHALALCDYSNCHDFCFSYNL